MLNQLYLVFMCPRCGSLRYAREGQMHVCCMPELSMFRMDRLGRGFMIRMFFPEGKIDDFYDIQPELMQNIANSWDAYKAKKA